MVLQITYRPSRTAETTIPQKVEPPKASGPMQKQPQQGIVPTVKRPDIVDNKKKIRPLM